MTRTKLPQEHYTFIKWAKEQGVVVNNIEPAKYKDSGIGITVTAPLKEGDVVVSCPATALLTIDSKFVKAHNLPKTCTVHGKLAAYLTLTHNDADAPHRFWRKAWPSEADMNDSMPIKWEETLKDYLPAHAKVLLANQAQNLQKDWEQVQDLFPSELELFTYYWITINTRTFYWDYPTNPRLHSQVKKGKLSRDDCYALCPFIDYFNHADEGCAVTADKEGFKMTCDRDYEVGEEIYVTYGTHSNDFLLIEYGFILPENKWDSLKLDELITSNLTKKQAAELEERGFLGNYTMDSRGPCFRTQVALRAMLLRIGRVDFFIGAVDEGDADKEKVEAHLAKLLTEYCKSVQRRLGDIEEEPQSNQTSVLIRRWKQLYEIANQWVNSREQA